MSALAILGVLVIGFILWDSHKNPETSILSKLKTRFDKELNK